MIPLTPKPPPPGFNRRVRDKGHRWLQAHPDAPASKFPDYWNEIREETQTAFDGCCAYLGFPIASGQIDHFIAKSANRLLAYEWTNFRWGEPRVNLLKGTKTFLDPFSLQPGWITIDPATLDYGVGAALPAHLQGAAEATLSVLNDPELLRGRIRMLRPFVQTDGTWDVEKLRDFFPLLAEAIAAVERETA